MALSNLSNCFADSTHYRCDLFVIKSKFRLNQSVEVIVKYIGLVFILLLMKLTWSMAEYTPATDAQTHAMIQNELKEIIAQSLLKLRPSASQLIFRTMWTEQLEDNKVKAHFSYSYNDKEENGEQISQVQEGFGILNRVPNPQDPESTSWSLDEVTISQEAIDFKTGIVITPQHK